MATTTNFGWETPDDTDLVKDGAAAIRTVANSIDTSFVDLKGGTTGQVLSKASNTDLDFTWVTDAGDIAGVTAGTGITGGGTSGTVTITNDMATKIDAKGDLVVGTAADAYDRLAVGTNGHVLTADSTASTGMKWASPASSGQNFSLLGTGTLTGAATVTVSSISGQDMLMILIKGASSASASSVIGLRLNTDTGSNYKQYGIQMQVETSYNAINFAGVDRSGTYFTLGALSANAGDKLWGGATIFGANSAGKKMMQQNAGGGSELLANGQWLDITSGFYDSASTISSVSLFSATGNFDAGTFEVYGSA